MKMLFAGIFFLCLAVVGLIIVLAPDLFMTPSKPPRQKTVVVADAGRVPEVRIDRIDPPNDGTTPVPTQPPPVPPTLLEPVAPPAPPAQSIASPDPLPPPEKDLVIISAERLPPPPGLQSTADPAFAPPDASLDQPGEMGIGLLTDTGETEENRIAERNRRQVALATPQQKMATIPKVVERQVVKREGNMEITVVPEGSYPYSILLDTLDKLSNAQQAIATYRKRGIASYWVKVDLGTLGVKYRLFTGMFPGEREAKSFLAGNRLSGKLIKSTPYAALIGTYREKQDLAIAFAQSREAGVFPYILGTENGPFFLYVGAFYTLAGAENQCLEMTGKGLPCQAVPRATLAP